MKNPPKLKQAIKDLSTAVAHVIAMVESIGPSDVSMIAKALRELREAKDLLEVESKIIGELYNGLSYHTFPEALEAIDMDSAKIGGYNFIVTERFNASIPDYKRELGHAWVRDVLRTPQLIRETVNPKQLTTVVKAYFDTYAISPPKQAVTFNVQKLTTIKKG